MIVDRRHDLTHQGAFKSSIVSIEFHPTQSVAFVASQNGVVRVFNIEEEENTLVLTAFFKGYITGSAFMDLEGNNIYVCGKQRHIFKWNLPDANISTIRTNSGGKGAVNSLFTNERSRLSRCGKYIAVLCENGWIHILSTKTGQKIEEAKIEGEVADLAWKYDSSGFTVISSSGEFFEWNLEGSRFESRWFGEGGYALTKIAYGGERDEWLAVGSESGIVDIYNTRSSNRRKPVKSLGQLITSVTSLEFSPDGQILAMASNLKTKQLKLIHFPSLTAFKNWPTGYTPLSRVHAVAFNPSSDMIAVGNEQGKVLLYTIKQ